MGLGGSLVYYLKITYNRPLHNDSFGQLQNSLMGVLGWQWLVLCACLLLRKRDFEGGIYLFYLGVPVILLLSRTQSDRRRSLLITEVAQLKSGGELVQRIRYFLKLIGERGGRINLNNDQRQKEGGGAAAKGIPVPP